MPQRNNKKNEETERKEMMQLMQQTAKSVATLVEGIIIFEIVYYGTVDSPMSGLSRGMKKCVR